MKQALKLIALSFLACSFLLPNITFCQVTAGSIPPGTSVYFTPVDMSVIDNESDTITFVDLDGDGIEDIRIWLIKGNPPSDAPNMVVFFALGNTFSFCNVTEGPDHVAYYQSGDTLCWNDDIWGSDSIYTVGCFGGWNCIQDETPVIDKYVAYRKNATNEIGWLKVSMSLYSSVDQNPVTFTISEMLVLYLGSSTENANNEFALEIFPNPSIDGRFVIRAEQQLSTIEVFNYAGQRINYTKFDEDEYSLPALQGVYLVRAINVEGNYAIRRVLRL